MFVQQKKLTYLNMPGKRLRRLFSSTVDDQVVLPGYPAQMASAYLAALASSGGIQVVLGLYLAESRCSVFFLPQSGEVPPEKAEMMMQHGLEFAESMGFVLADADIHKLPQDKLDSFWSDLPICKPPAPEPAKQVKAAKQVKQVARENTNDIVKQSETSEQTTPAVAVPLEKKKTKPVYTLEQRRERCRQSLGRFLASL